MLLTGVLNSLSSFAKQLIVKKFLPYKTHVPHCCKIQVHQHAFTLLKSIHIWQMKHFGINSAPHWRMSGRSFSLALSLLCLSFFLHLSSSPSSLPFFAFSRRHLPTSAHLQGTNIWEMQFEHFSATKKRQTMLEKRGDKHAAELMLDKHVAFSPIHKWPCHVQRSQVWKFKDKLDCARGRCCCFWVCLLVVLVSLLLFDRFAPWGMRSFKMTGEGWVLLKDENKGISLHQMLSLEEEISKQRSRVHRPSCWSSSSGELSVSLMPFGLRELQES